MVRKQVGIENNASLEVSKQQLEHQQQQQKQEQPEPGQRIDIDLTPDPPTNFAQQAHAIYAPLKPSTLATSYEHSASHNFNSLQHAQLANMPYNFQSALPPPDTVSSSGNGIPISSMPTEIPAEDEERLERIFNQLDRDGDGKVDIHDLSAALHEFGLSSVYAEKFMQQSDKNQSGNVGFAEFLHYVREHEKNLCLQFSHLDKNRDGKVDLEELISAFKDLGLEIDVDEARKLLTRMDKDGSLNISFNEWRDFMLLAPSTDIHDLIKFWRHSTEDWSGQEWLRSLAAIYQEDEAVRYLDIGEDMNVPDDFTQKEMQTGLWWRHLVAGGIAGGVSRTCTAPLDRIKVYLQVQTTRMGISECAQIMLNEGGSRSMWRGNGINVLKIAPETALKFAAYEQMKRLIRGEDASRQMSIVERFYAGAAAGGISQTIIYPMEVLKTRLALRKTGQYAGIADAAAKIYKNEGARSFYRGYVPNILGILPYAGIDLAVYETLKRRYIASHDNNEQPSFLVLLACGSTSSALGQLCSYPLALVRTRLQAQAAETITNQKRKTLIPLKSSDAHSGQETMTGLFRKIVKQEGLTGLYRGITPNFLKVLPAVSISYVVYEYSSRALGIKMS
ncbi:calcium-binding mitochondrial carrier protein SCaMC-1-B isoform X1 [Drosophila guanche]|uniref:calcium-binding mitochondrial carrier protein SCaMC-1-B isoform X1 n=1 Tax=Drosophila guanche TaxID=7266 RepID=UPI001471F443|nr:calcium-binding mitochondrial carrier protein SCaMC-1-B isoform X1 [Drosophila guanche]XP_034137150.1 calcium-binding mitochondrial carrier protein SCaMC-1-B isoform X1 [Drosophila guanche]XP_034137153.1 calcium-binding mitochondrial carrier protein SCaMC-1-B isoform X1 [Drosophila guanche]